MKNAAAPIPVAELRGDDLGHKGTTFVADGFVYVCSGEILGKGGTGRAYLARRHAESESGAGAGGEDAVLKVLSEDTLWKAQHVPVLRHHFEHNRAVMARVDGIDHPRVLRHLLVTPIADNFMLIRPRVDGCLTTFVAGRTGLGPAERLALFIEGLEGLSALHAAGVIHGDFTPRNLAVRGNGAVKVSVFDFDLSVCPDLLPPERRTYRGYFEGYLVGCPELSTSPEVVDEALSGETMSARSDVYAAGAGLFALLTDASIYGAFDDVEQVERRIREGVVRGEQRTFEFPKDFPKSVRPLVERCLQRRPADRFADAGELLGELRRVARRRATLGRGVPIRGRTRTFVRPARGAETSRSLFDQRPDHSLTFAQYKRAQHAVANYGYRVDRCLPRLKGHGVFVVAPEPALVAADQFIDKNAFRKIVTVVDLHERADPDAAVRTWNERVRPIVERVRQRHLTRLYRSTYDTETQQLLLFTEYVADSRFGADVLPLELPARVVLAVALTLAEPLRLLHREGLAHDNVSLGSVMFVPDRDAGTARPLLAGLVEPSLEAAARAEDVRGLAGVVTEMAARAGFESPEAAWALESLVTELGAVARGEGRGVVIDALSARIGEALAALDANFGVLRRAGAGTLAYAALLSQPVLYHRLFR